MKFVAVLLAVSLAVVLRASDFSTPVLSVAPGSQLLSADGINYYLSVQVYATNMAPPATVWVLEHNTNGVDWYHASGDVHSTNTQYGIIKVWQSTYDQLRSREYNSYSNGPYSSIVGVWGEMCPKYMTVTVADTNTAVVSFKDESAAEDGFLVQRATNSAFTGTLLETSLEASPGFASHGGATLYVTNYGYERDMTYYWRAYATNAIGYSTEASAAIFSAPNASPLPANNFQARNGVSGVVVTWETGGGMVDRWYLDISVGDTNNFSTFYNVAGGGASYTKNDNGRTPGTTCYYRVAASNQVGIAYSTIKSVLIPADIGSTVWYVDASATGNGNGDSWANAFPSFSAVAWNNIHPGALIWIAKGTYHETAYCTDVDGEANAPITFKVAQDAEHGGKVYLDQIKIWRNNIHWDGAASDLFTLTSTEGITNNIHLVLGSTNVQWGVFASYTGGGLSLKWMEMSQTINPELIYTNGMNLYGEGTTAGMDIKGNPPQSSNEIAYIWVHDLEGDGLDVSMYSVTDWKEVDVHHCIVERVRGNFMSGNGGDYHDCILRDIWRTGQAPPGVHPDGPQLWPPYLRVYNNVIRDTSGQAIYIELVPTNTVGVMIYNNVVYGTGAVTGEAGVVYPNNGITFSTEPQVASPLPFMVVTNCLIANNTFYGFSNPYLTVSRRADQTDTLLLRGWEIANNLFYTAVSSSQVDVSPNDYTTTDVLFRMNDVSGGNTKARYSATEYATMAALDAATGFTNISVTPSLAHVSSNAGQSYAWDFHLTPADKTNLVGLDLSAWESTAPGISRNLDGTARSDTGWPIGALSTSLGDGLVEWLSFSNWSGGTVADGSSMLNDAALTGVATNSPAPVSGPNGLPGAHFSDYNYLAITNWNGLTVLSNGTIAAWIWYTNAVGNSLVLDAGYDGITNSWRFGRVDGSANTKFVSYDDSTGTRQYLVDFPDSGQNTTNWNHYAVTWNGTNVYGYWNGQVFQTNTLDYPLFSYSPYHWIGVGTMHHTGTPEYGDDAYPNCCWIRGSLSDLRIYNRALSSGDITAVYQNTGVSGGSGDGGGEPSPQRLILNSLRASSIRFTTP